MKRIHEIKTRATNRSENFAVIDIRFKNSQEREKIQHEGTAILIFRLQYRNNAW